MTLPTLLVAARWVSGKTSAVIEALGGHLERHLPF